VTVVEEAKYLGSYAARAGNDLRDVEARIDKASRVFGALKHCLFTRKDVSIEAKRGVYSGLVLAMLFFGAEHWCLTTKMVRMLRAFHHRPMRTMCRLNLHHTRHNHVRARTLLNRLGIQTIDTYITRRQLRWLGHVWWTPTARVPKRLLTAWLPQKRPVGRSGLTYGHTVVRTIRAVEQAGGFVGSAAALAAATAATAAAVATKAVDTAAEAIRAAGAAPRQA
jgi:hypothetical protein